MTAMLQHPRFTRRAAVQAGAVGLLGLGMNHVRGLQALAGASAGKARAVIYIFLSGGISQHESFDPKPDAPEGIRGEFRPIATRTPGLNICEHLPLLAARSDRWSLVRSLTHPHNAHSAGHLAMLTGRSQLPPGFDPDEPKPTDWPCFASMAMALCPPRHNLPPAVVLPEKLVHVTGRTIPGQFAGAMGKERDPWFVEASHFRSSQYIHGAFPEFGFERRTGKYVPDDYRFEAPSLSLPAGVIEDRLQSRIRLLDALDGQRRGFDRAGQDLDRHRQEAVSLLLDKGVHQAFDVHGVDAKVQDRYGRNSFGWSLLMARQLVEAGVSLVQVNLGNNESWDTHENIFRNLKNFLLPPADRAISALLDDLEARGRLDSTLIVIGSEFGRTPKISVTNGGAKTPGRDHWGAVQSVFLAGGGIQGGRVIGASDKIGAYPSAAPQKPENLAATIYQSLGLPPTIHWQDKLDRPHFVYHGDPIGGLA